jgi:CysZ protein
MGLGSFFRGFGLLASTPGAYPFAMVPVVAAVVLTAGFSVLSVLVVPALVERWTGPGGFWVDVLQVLATLAFLILSTLLGLVLAQPASGPALEAMVRRLEARLGAPPRPDTPFLTEVARSAGSATIALVGGLASFFVLLLLSLIPGAAVVIGWDVCDYPLSVRGLPLRRRIEIVTANLGAVLGFALGLGLVALVPCGFLLLLPVGVSGATVLMHEVHRWDESKLLRGR